MPSSRLSKTSAAEPPRIDQVIGYQLARAAIRTREVFFQAAGNPFDVRPVEYTILALISENAGIAPARLAEALAVTAPNITARLAGLEQRGLVTRVASEADRRAQVLSLTPAGTRLVADATRALIEAEKTAFPNLSAGEYLLMCELLRKLAAAPPLP